jgi:hypothetical protein
MEGPQPPPEGIGDDHQRPYGGWRRHASPLSIVVFGAVVVLALTGALGHERDWHASRGGVELHVHAPAVIRNGEFLEMRFRVIGDERIEELVIGVEPALWEDLTVNTMIPAPTEEASEDGEFRFTFSALEPDTEFLWKVDLQVNPDVVLGNRGGVTVYDGEEPLVATELAVEVLP